MTAIKAVRRNEMLTPPWHRKFTENGKKEKE